MCISVTPIKTVLIHKKCHRDFTDQKRGVERNAEENKVLCAKRSRSSSLLFNWKEHCMLCGKLTTIDAHHPSQTQVKTITTLPLRTEVV